MITLEQLASWEAIDRIVGERPSPRWNRSSPTLRRSDGHSRETWFVAFPPKVRVRLVREFLLDQAEWQALLRFRIPKVGKVGHRNIDVPTVLGQAAQYVVYEWFRDAVEADLGKWCLAYRRGQQFQVNCRRVHRMVSRCPWTQPLDVTDFFGSIRHTKLDAAVDRLDADDALKGVLSRLWRVTVIDSRGRPVERRPGVGIGQGLVLSPVAANVYSAATWSRINREISSRSAAVPYYCDDGLAAAPTPGDLAATVQVARTRLFEIGLSTTTGAVVDTRERPMEWLGLLFGQGNLDVSSGRIDSKIHEWQLLVEHDQLSRDGVESSMEGLLAHYRRLLPPARVSSIERQMKAGIDSISFPPFNGRREVEFLQSLRG
jgi:hypothetical protein